jgi:hypothetical protein
VEEALKQLAREMSSPTVSGLAPGLGVCGEPQNFISFAIATLWPLRYYSMRFKGLELLLVDCHPDRILGIYAQDLGEPVTIGRPSLQRLQMHLHLDEKKPPCGISAR